MSDTHWLKVTQAVNYYSQSQEGGPGDVESLLDLMQEKRAKMLDEDFLDRYIARKNLEQEAAIFEAQRQAFEDRFAATEEVDFDE